MATLLDGMQSKSASTALIVASPTPVFLSHLELLQQAQSFQKKLAKIGISPKEAVAIALPNTIEFAVAFLATTFQRAISAPLNSAYKQEEFEFYLTDLKASILVLPRGAVARNGEAVRAARMCGTAIAEIYWDELEVVLELVDARDVRNRGPVKIERPVEDDVALILHTSGTTGRPKAVRTLLSLRMTSC